VASGFSVKCLSRSERDLDLSMILRSWLRPMAQQVRSGGMELSCGLVLSEVQYGPQQGLDSTCALILV